MQNVIGRENKNKSDLKQKGMKDVMKLLLRAKARIGDKNKN